MAVGIRGRIGLLCLILPCILAGPLMGQNIEDQLSAYTGENAKGYIQPLAEAFGADLNGGFYYSAHIPKAGLTLRLEFPVMGVVFNDDHKTFKAKTELGFSPSQTVDAPTVVGSGNAVVVPGDGGTSFAFPGGLSLNSFGIVVPQLRFGNFLGTEGVIRYFAANIGDSEIGDVQLYGFGIRHSISQYFNELPVDISAGLLWQAFTLGENGQGGDMVDSKAFTFGLQVSKRFELLEPFGGLSYDTYNMDLSYISEATGSEEVLDVKFDSINTVRLTLGLSLNLRFINAHACYNIASMNSFRFGLAIGI